MDDGASPERRFSEAAAVGMGIDLEIATLAKTLAHARALPSAAALSVNVSPALVLDLRLGELLKEYRDERTIVLEITEREAVEDYGVLREAISRIPVPVQWAIDDAGAGYSSLRHIVELRPHHVKLDRGLINDIALDPARQAMVAGLLHFSNAIGAGRS